MPIVDVEIVSRDAAPPPSIDLPALARALGRAFECPAHQTWLRLRRLPESCYAENGPPASDGSLPVFVTVLQAHTAHGEALADEVLEITQVVASAVGRPADRVHVLYAPPAAGRQAFGGRLVR